MCVCVCQSSSNSSFAYNTVAPKTCSRGGSAEIDCVLLIEVVCLCVVGSCLRFLRACCSILPCKHYVRCMCVCVCLWVRAYFESQPNYHNRVRESAFAFTRGAAARERVSCAAHSDCIHIFTYVIIKCQAIAGDWLRSLRTLTQTSFVCSSAERGRACMTTRWSCVLVG